MRFRIGLLQDTKEIEKQIVKDAKEAADAKKPPTVKTEAETRRDEARSKDPEKDKSKAKKPKIKPLPEAKAIELGANFVSETFLLAVGIALILFENARRGRQEAKKDEGQTGRIDAIEKRERVANQAFIEMEKEILRLRSKDGTSRGSSHRILPKEIREPEEEEDIGAESRAKGWLPWIPSLFRTQSKEGIQPKEPAIINAPETETEAQPADSIPSISTSVLSKILPRTHVQDVNPKIATHPADPSPTRAAYFASGPPGQTPSVPSTKR